MTKFFKTETPNHDEILRKISIVLQNGNLANDSGSEVSSLERELERYLRVDNLLLVSNGTIALQFAYRLLDLPHGGEIITTPFTFLATSSSADWERLIPVFGDINPNTFNLDPNSVEKLITKRTKAIVPVHTFGNTCDVEAFDRISIKYGIPIIYDAAHSFGIKSKYGHSVLNKGDISTLSFHATKVFHTVEGGAIICKDKDMYERAKAMREFGEFEKGCFGLNGKMSEVHAIIGREVLKGVDSLIEKRKQIHDVYESIDGVGFQEHNRDYIKNYGYFPIVFQTEKYREYIEEKLLSNGFKTRRYFYPSLDQKYYGKTSSKSKSLADRILCLPIYPEFEKAEEIVDIINRG